MSAAGWPSLPPISLKAALLTVAEENPSLAQHAVRVSYHSCGKYRLEGFVYGFAALHYEQVAKDEGLAFPVPGCVLRANEYVLTVRVRPWSHAKAKRRFLRRYRELTWNLTPWDEFVIAVRRFLGKDGCR